MAQQLEKVMTKIAGDEMREKQPLNTEDIRLMNAYWRAANYLSVGQIYSY